MRERFTTATGGDDAIDFRSRASESLHACIDTENGIGLPQRCGLFHSGDGRPQVERNVILRHHRARRAEKDRRLARFCIEIGRNRLLQREKAKAMHHIGDGGSHFACAQPISIGFDHRQDIHLGFARDFLRRRADFAEVDVHANGVGHSHIESGGRNGVQLSRGGSDLLLESDIT